MIRTGYLQLHVPPVHSWRVPILTPPATPLDDGQIGLRPFLLRDLATFQAATRPGGNEGFWLIVDSDDPTRSLLDHINSWYTEGHVGPGNLLGPVLAIVDAQEDAPVGSMNIIVRAADRVELSYGVAPPHRGRGVATRALILAADWLLNDERWGSVELRIADDAHASQRVAHRAGFREAGRVRTWVPSVAQEFDDRLYLRTNIEHRHQPSS